MQNATNSNQNVLVLYFLFFFTPFFSFVYLFFVQGPAAGKTVMVVNINPSTQDFDETQQGGRYRQQALNLPAQANFSDRYNVI